jgi:hypothetical protein
MTVAETTAGKNDLGYAPPQVGFPMMKPLLVGSLGVLLSGALGSCGCHYKTERHTLREGQPLATHHNGTYRLERVTAKSITLSHSDERIRHRMKLDCRGRWGRGEAHSLGNNEDLKILVVEPSAKTVCVELTWRDGCGPLSIPSF